MLGLDNEPDHETGPSAGWQVHKSRSVGIRRTRICALHAKGARLTAADHTPTTDQAAAQQIGTDDPQTASHPVDMGSRPRLWNQLLENPLLSLFGAVIVMLLGYVLTTSNIRITETNERITRLDNRIEDRFNGVEDRFDRLEDRIIRNSIGVEGRFNGVEDRFVRMEARIEDRFVRLETRVEDRFVRLEARVEDRFNRVDTRIGTLEGSVAEIDRKLTALIAALGKTDEVKATLAADPDATRTAEPLDGAADTSLYWSFGSPHSVPAGAAIR